MELHKYVSTGRFAVTMGVMMITTQVNFTLGRVVHFSATAVGGEGDKKAKMTVTEFLAFLAFLA